MLITVLFLSADYSVARTKLKLAEQLSDVNTSSEKEEYLKKSRKQRAAKSYSSSNDDDDESDEEVVSSLPKPPSKENENKTSKMREIQLHRRKNFD